MRIALVGPLSPSLIEGPTRRPSRIDSDRTHLLKRGQVLRVGMVEGSSTAYLAVAGGFACTRSWAASRPMRAPASAASRAASSPPATPCR